MRPIQAGSASGNQSAGMTMSSMKPGLLRPGPVPAVIRPRPHPAPMHMRLIRNELTKATAVQPTVTGETAATVVKTLGSIEDPLTMDSLDTSLDTVDLDANPAATSDQEENPYTTADAAVSPEGLLGVGELELEKLLAEGGQDLSVDRVCQVFPYPLDNFQKKALEKFLEGQSVVVCAPTGAGKTAIAEAAAAATLARGQRVIYTTPLKALSNQKLFEMRKRFGHVRCGLQTGDTSLNTEAQVVIMTTEILRNIMYRMAEQQPSSSDEEAEVELLGEEDEDEEGSEGPISRERLGDVGLVVMDEVHYLGDRFRGSVWEEAIINCPRHIQLLCMSATVRNPDDLGAWISKEHMPCTTIKTSFRPVPLRWHHAYTAPPPRGLQLIDLLSRDGKRLNSRLESKAVIAEEARAYMQRRSRSGDGDWLDGNKGYSAVIESDPQSFRKTMAKRVPGLEPLIKTLKKQNMLPAIWFILSRKECDLSAMRAATGTVMLTSQEEQASIREELSALQADQPEAVREALVPALIRGIASHHAGHLPGWKSLVERLFQRNLLKIVFATGTLAAGINMPARTTVISALSRKTDEGPQPLPHNELLQMAGRAGRRGFDTEGNCVVLQTRFDGPEEAWAILRAGPEPLVSYFNVSYGLVLNLLSVYSLEQSKAFCNKSFGSYLMREGNAKRQEEAKQLEARISDMMADFEATASSTAKKLTEAVMKARDELREVRQQTDAQRMRAGAEMLEREGLPRKVVLSLMADRKNSKGMRSFTQPAVLLSKVKSGSTSPDGNSEYVYEGLGADNRLVRVNAMHVVAWLGGEEGTMDDEDAHQVHVALQKAVGWAPLASRVNTVLVAPGNSTTALIALQLQPQVTWNQLPVDKQMTAKLDAAKLVVRDALAAQDAHRRREQQEVNAGAGSGRRDTDQSSMDQMAKARSLQRRLDKLREEMEQAGGENTWRNFTEVVDILTVMGALRKDTLSLQPLGLVARNIQGQNELWLALVLSHPSLYGLTGPELAGVLGAILCGEVVRKPGQISAAYMASQKVVDAVNAMEGQRQLLSELQAGAGLGMWNDALLLDLRLAGIVEAWAAGATWKQVVMDSGMDDGDIARLFIRTGDLLRQLSWQQDLLPHLMEPCMEALRGMDRKPIAEVLV